jgi:hypothetical protein
MILRQASRQLRGILRMAGKRTETRQLRLLVTLALALSVAVFAFPGSRPPRRAPSHLYVADVGDVDFYPYWEALILDLSQETGAVRASYDRIESSTQPCGEPGIRHIEKVLAGQTIQDIVGTIDVCGLDADRINRLADKRTRKPGPFATSRVAIVATCDGIEKVFRLPEFKMNVGALKREAPEIVTLLGLRLAVYGRAFAGAPDAQPAIDQATLATLKAGRFDQGFWFGLRGVPPPLAARVVTGPVDTGTLEDNSDLAKFHNVLRRYKGPPLDPHSWQAKLISAQGHSLSVYVPAKYSPLAVSAHIGGVVELQLTVNSETGAVEQAESTGGHPLIREAAITAVKQWVFQTSRDLPSSIKAILQFSLDCDAKLPQPEAPPR